MTGLFYVMFGGAVGAGLRHLAGIWTMRILGSGFPSGTMIVNIVGSFAMGLLVVWLSKRSEASMAMRLGLATGLLGGFTTFSSFSLDALALWERGNVGLAFIYVFGSVALALIGIAAGLAIGRATL